MKTGPRIQVASLVVLLTLSGFGGARATQAALVLGGTTGADDIYCVTFDRVGLVNPSVTFPDIPNVGDLTVDFGTKFIGQTYGEMHNSLDDTVPLPPLRLDPAGMVKTMFDISSPTGVMLGGMKGKTMYTTPLAILFSSDVNYVAFDLGHLDENTPTRIEAYDRLGNSLGVFDGLSPGHESYSLVDNEGQNVIAGVSIYVPSEGMDWEGFGLNNIKFALDQDGVIPEPGTFVVWSLLVGCALSGAWWKRRRHDAGI